MKRPKVNCSAIFKTNPTDRGMCCTFNALAAEEIYRWSLASPAFYIDWNLLQKVTVLWVCCKSPKRKCSRLLWGSTWTAWGVRNTSISSQIGFWRAKIFLGLSYSNWIVLSPTGGASQGMSPGLKLVSLRLQHKSIWDLFYKQCIIGRGGKPYLYYDFYVVTFNNDDVSWWHISSWSSWNRWPSF